MNNNDFIGVDVSKEKFDACLVQDAGSSLHKTFDHTDSGFKEFLAWIKQHSEAPWVCMEATGHYSEILADFLISNNIKVSVVNPVQIKYFAKVKLSRNKNDKVDAKIIAEYCKVMKPRLFQPRSSEQKHIRELIQLEDTLKTQRTQLKLQLSCTQSPEVKKEFIKAIKMLDRRIKSLLTVIESIIEQNEEWNRLVNLIISIKGFGKLSAYHFLAYLPDVKLFKNAKQLAAFIGVSPKQKESGKYHGQTKISKFGNPKLRKVLYMPALSAKRSNEALHPFVNRLKNNGLSPKSIVVAVMRKLVHIIFGMLKTNSTFNPNLV